ncbi:hypothetical protein K439DRAFT_1643283 [Ramaria rubella]|nr:hypothetical protein K439DRAFT_1643283 [Ramaria rubella]
MPSSSTAPFKIGGHRGHQVHGRTLSSFDLSQRWRSSDRAWTGDSGDRALASSGSQCYQLSGFITATLSFRHPTQWYRTVG